MNPEIRAPRLAGCKESNTKHHHFPTKKKKGIHKKKGKSSKKEQMGLYTWWDYRAPSNISPKKRFKRKSSSVLYSLIKEKERLYNIN